MAMIDAMNLIEAFRAGRSDRAADDKRKAAEAAAKEWDGALGELYTGQPQGGVQGQFAPSNPKPTMESAFSPDAMSAMGRGEAPPPMQPQGAQAQYAPQQPRTNPMALAKLIALDPEAGAKIATALKSMDEAALKQAQAKNDIMGSAASYVRQGRTPEERMARFRQAAPQLIAMGWSPQELDGVDNDLSDMALQGYEALAIAYDNRIDNELAEREFMAGKNIPIQAGGNVVNVKPDGSASYVVAQPGVGGGASPNTQTIDGKTYYQDPATGKWFDEPLAQGGQTPPASGAFRLVSNAKSVIEQVLPGVRVTDHIRSANSALGRKNPGSYHVRSGAAVDIKPIPGMTFEQAAQRLRAAGYQVHPDSRDEVKNPSGHATGPHWHFVIGKAA